MANLLVGHTSCVRGTAASTSHAVGTGADWLAAGDVAKENVRQCAAQPLKCIEWRALLQAIHAVWGWDTGWECGLEGKQFQGERARKCWKGGSAGVRVVGLCKEQ